MRVRARWIAHERQLAPHGVVEGQRVRRDVQRYFEASGRKSQAALALLIDRREAATPKRVAVDEEGV